ncbi:MAG: c-type cytochrome [Caldilineaceae bacterium]|nr:c-type cytochrome [Caldilineaceae bacterium]
MQFIDLFGFWRKVGALCVAGLLVAGVAAVVNAAPLAQSASDGEALFKAQCVACHTIGGGNLVGPDLQGVTGRQERAWLERWIREPDKMLAEGDPIATQLLQESNNVPMPNLGLTETQVASLLAYLESQAGGATAPESAPQSAPQSAPDQAQVTLPVGAPAIGRSLFTGSMRFANGGPPCMGCHSIAGLGALGGGALGPDLTPAFNKFGETGLANFLATSPTLTMNAVWTRQPLTPDEQASIWSFLRQASVTERPIQALGQLSALAIVGAAVLIFLAHLYWRKRLVAVRRPLVERARISA